MRHCVCISGSISTSGSISGRRKALSAIKHASRVRSKSSICISILTTKYHY